MNSNSGTYYSLETLAEAVNYNEFVYSRMRPYLGTRILELGAGIGNLTPFFLRYGTHVTAIDIDPNLIRIHRERVESQPRLHVECCSMEDLAGRAECRDQFDSVVSSNVLEHISDGTIGEVVRAMMVVLKPGAYAVHWVPAFQGIFGTLDKAFRHHRRYSKVSATKLFESAGFGIQSVTYWNMPGFFGWWLYGRILRVSSIPRSSALTFDKCIVPILRVVEPRLWRPFGQSLLIVARKPV
jgi:SAM-dependent methyltransferase